MLVLEKEIIQCSATSCFHKCFFPGFQIQKLCQKKAAFETTEYKFVQNTKKIGHLMLKFKIHCLFSKDYVDYISTTELLLLGLC